MWSIYLNPLTEQVVWVEKNLSVCISGWSSLRCGPSVSVVNCFKGLNHLKSFVVARHCLLDSLLVIVFSPSLLMWQTVKSQLSLAGISPTSSILIERDNKPFGQQGWFSCRSRDNNSFHEETEEKGVSRVSSETDPPLNAWSASFCLSFLSVCVYLFLLWTLNTGELKSLKDNAASSIFISLRFC